MVIKYVCQTEFILLNTPPQPPNPPTPFFFKELRSNFNYNKILIKIR